VRRYKESNGLELNVKSQLLECVTNTGDPSHSLSAHECVRVCGCVGVRVHMYVCVVYMCVCVCGV